MKSEHLFIIRLGDGRHFEYGWWYTSCLVDLWEVQLEIMLRRRWPFNCLRSSGLLPHEGRISVGTAKWGGTLGSFLRGLFEQGRAPKHCAPVFD